jgi:hypothetical protein
MASASLEQLCHLVCDVAITNAIALRQQLTDLVTPHSLDLDPEHVLNTFAFMNWTLAQGVWSNLEHARLRRDLQAELRRCLIMKLAEQLVGSTTVEDIAAKAVFLMEDLSSYIMGYSSEMGSLGYADSGTARLFALERIQEEHGINDDVMDDIVPSLWADKKANSEVESVAMQVNKVAAEMKPEGLWRRLFGG